MSYHVSVDVGGTFTDLFAVDAEAGSVIVQKADTSEDAVGGVLAVLEQGGIPLERVEDFVIGTTLATNALVEGRTAAVAFLGTRGFTDNLEIRRVWRAHLFGWRWERPKPLVTHALRFGIGGRIDWQGKEIEPFVRDDVDTAVAEMRRRGVTTAAVSLLFSFINPEHERRVMARIAELAPEIRVVLSSDVNPEIKEYERASTTVIAAAITPLVERLLADLEARLRDSGVRVPLQVVKSNGGVMSFASARAKPWEILRSGPAGGVASALRLSRARAIPNLIAVDIGGTTADVSVVTDGEITYTQQADLAWDVPVRVNMADVRSVGAGGGSIAWMDRAARLHVGPRSAGAKPGPVSYGRGGTEPTVTDAALVAGLIDPGRFLGGRMKVDLDTARSAVETRTARPLGMKVEAAAGGIFKLASATMAQLIQEMTVQVGLDPRDYALVGFGGAGPLFVAALTQEIGASRGIVPPYPAVWSALGGLSADVAHDYARSQVAEMAEVDLEALNGIARSLIEQSRSDLERDGLSKREARSRFIFDLRYVGQSHEIPVPLDSAPPFDRATLRQVEHDFDDLHDKLYAHRRPEESRQLVTVRLEVRVPRGLSIPDPALADESKGAGPAHPRSVWFHDYDHAIETAIYNRDDLPAGARLEGPAIVEEDQSNTIVPPGMTCSVGQEGDLIIERKAS